jgi:type 1 glutamine amidotransferase
MIIVLLGMATAQGEAQSVLHYTETSGFDHGTRAASLTLFQQLGALHGFQVTDDVDGASFGSLASLQQFDVVVFSNTSGNNILSPLERANFEAYISGGGSVLGIHAATDTYRHSTANGGNTGTWDFYAELIGASVQENPNHVSGTPLYDLLHVAAHPSTANLPDPWPKNEEYYYWESGYYEADNVTVLIVEGTIGPNGLVNSYDAPRSMSWYRELPQGGRMFYTALGHAVSNYTTDTLFRAHIRDALLWVMDAPSAMSDVLGPWFSVAPNPATEVLLLPAPGCVATLVDVMGRAHLHVGVPHQQLDLRSVPPGTYCLHLQCGNRAYVGRVVIQH